MSFSGLAKQFVVVVVALIFGAFLGSGRMIASAEAQAPKGRGDCVLITTSRSTYDFKKEINANYTNGYEVKGIVVRDAITPSMYMAVMCN